MDKSKILNNIPAQRGPDEAAGQTPKGGGLLIFSNNLVK
jgi:hypothetical protein